MITRGVTSVGQSAANLHGTVNPNGAATTYYFQVGTTRSYGAQTTPASAGAGTKARNVSSVAANLAPATTYHYRLVASNPKGVTSGVDRTFKTKAQPLGVTLTANPNPVLVGGSATLSGTLSGTGNGGRQVVLQSNPYPYTQGFQNSGNPLVTDANGNFSFPVLSVPVNTQFRVQMPQKPQVVSPIVVENTVVRVTTHSRLQVRGRHSGRIHLWGSLYPPADGVGLRIQRFDNNHWKTLYYTKARHASAQRSTYTKTFWVRHGGRFRVFVNDSGPRSLTNGRTVTIHHVTR